MARTYECPNCGEEVEHFSLYGNAPTPYCDECNKMVAEDKIKKTNDLEEIPEGAIVKKEKKGPTGPKTKEEEETKKESGFEEETEDLYERPKKPWEVMDEINKEYGCKSRFINFTYKQAKRRGGFTPEEYRYRLMNMKSGYDNREEIRDIAEDYAYQLEEEQEKAEDLGRPIDYPIGTSRKDRGRGKVSGRQTSRRTGGTRTERTAPGGRRESSTKKRVTGSRREGARESYEGRKENITGSDVREIISEVMEEKTKKSKLDRQKEKIDQLTDLIKEQQEQIQQVQQRAQQPSTPDNVVTKDELEDKEKNQYIQYLKEQNKNFRQELDEMQETVNDTVDKYGSTVEELREENRKLQNKIVQEKRSSSAGEGYSTDEFRLVSEGLDKVARATETRRPVEQIPEIIKSLDRRYLPEQEIPEREREKGSREGVTKKLDEELIAE